MDWAIEIVINILSLSLLCILYLPTYLWFNNIAKKETNNIYLAILALLIFLVIFSFVFDLRDDALGYFDIIDYGVEY